jgi:predicted nuclease with RNAse H fold
MNSHIKHHETVVGIDVGGIVKGYHAVAINGQVILGAKASTDPADILAFCLSHQANVVAVDAPCGWSCNGSSREAERGLLRKRVSCFSTPSAEKAQKSSFYGWVFNGAALYEKLHNHYALFDGNKTADMCCIETFPHAVVCALAGSVVTAKPKAVTRRQALESQNYKTDLLNNVDFLDAALCAISANYFSKNNFQSFGNNEEGYIVIPNGI